MLRKVRDFPLIGGQSPKTYPTLKFIMRHEDLPQRWKDKIKEYLSEKGSDYGKKYERLSLYEFSDNLNLKIAFDDGSYAFFQDAFYWIDNERKEVAVFTEHCGYHIFNTGELLLETFDWEGNLVKTDDFRTE